MLAKVRRHAEALCLTTALGAALLSSPAHAAPEGPASMPADRSLLVLGSHGHTHLRADPDLPTQADLSPSPSPFARPAKPPKRLSSAAHAASSRGPTVQQALQKLKSSGAITAAVYSEDRSHYLAAESSLKNLSGTRRDELGAVLANVQAIAADGGFIASRLPALFLTLVNNRTWWTTGPLLSSDERVSFPKSKLVWEYYPGQGIEIQWLATFGEGNGYYLSGDENSDLRQLLNEVIPLATKRAGGIAWEYMFRFDGGLPPWTSGLSQGTALQALSRGWSRLKEASYLTAAEQALGIFQKAPPEGVRVTTAQGNWYAEYTYAPTDKILNGFIQAIIGLYDFTSITHSSLGLQLFQSGDAVARVQTPHYNTGSWSMYDQYTESSLNYHELLAEFLKNLCQRTEQGSPLPPPAPIPTPEAPPTTTPATTTPAPPPTTTTPTTTPAPAPEAPTGGTEPAAAAATAHAATTPTSTTTSPTTTSPATTTPTSTATPKTSTSTPKSPITADAVYCTTATSFTEDLHQPPKVKLLSHELKTSSRAGVQISLSKVATVSITIRHAGKVIWTNRALVEGSKPRILWVTPSTPGSYSVTINATDLAGNSASNDGSIQLKS